MFTVVSDNTVAFLNLPFAEANRLAKIERAMGAKVVVRRTTQADIDADNARLIAIERILSDTKRGCPTGGVWKDPVSYKTTRYAGTI